MWRVMPYKIFGVALFAVEDNRGWIDKYCDIREHAQERCDELNA